MGKSHTLVFMRAIALIVVFIGPRKHHFWPACTVVGKSWCAHGGPIALGCHVAPFLALLVLLIGTLEVAFWSICNVVGDSCVVYGHQRASTETLVPFHFFICIHPPTIDRGPRCHVQISKIGHRTGPHP